MKMLSAKTKNRRHHMKTVLRFLLVTLALFAGVHQAAAQGTQFFRISGPTATIITAFNPDDTVVWSNAQPGATYTIQMVASLPGGGNWVDYNRFYATNGVNTNQLNNFSPFTGMALILGGPFTMGDTLDGESDAVLTNVILLNVLHGCEPGELQSMADGL